MATTVHEDMVVRMRRNGKQSSCEPCRISKLACDHNFPCARCARHGRACFYHPAPMTRKLVGKTLAVPSVTSEDAEDIPTMNEPRPIYRKTVSDPRIPTMPDSFDLPKAFNPLTLTTGGAIGYPRSPSRLSLGYMGSTGHSAILLENRGHLDPDVWDDASHNVPRSPGGTAHLDPDHPRQKFCNAILAWLPDTPLARTVMECYSLIVFTNTLHSPSLRHIHDSFLNTFGHLLEQPRRTENINALANILCQNSSRPLEVPTSNKNWLDSISGKNTRWESIGVFFIVYGYAALFLRDNHPVVKALIPPDVDKRSFACSMLECADACLLLCEELEAASNILGLGLFYRCVNFQRSLAGDGDLALWKRCGQLCNAITAAGFHRDTPITGPISTLYVELRFRVFVGTFALDKELATFTGRPPALSRSYVSTPLPLDVSEEDLMIYEGYILKDAVDSQGWNKTQTLYPATLIRAVYLSSVMQDEILELSLGTTHGDYITTRVRHVRQRLEQTSARLPPIFRLPLNKAAFIAFTAPQLFNIQSVQLQFLHNSFLLERVEHAERDEHRILDAAREMLSIVLALWANREGYKQLRGDLQWAICSYGIPSASALAVDLLKRYRIALVQPDLKSEVYHNLEMFVACLDWIDDDDGNVMLCQRVRGVIRGILDHLATPYVAGGGHLRDHEMSGQQDFSGFSIADIPLYGAGLEDWFDSAGFDQFSTFSTVA